MSLDVVQKMRAINQRVGMTQDGFVVHKRRWLCFWSHQPVNWDSVAEIKAVMWDVVSCHAFGYRLLLSDGASVCVTDLDDQWEDFRAKLHDAYPEIDSEVIGQVEAAFPGEIELTCWKKQQAQQAGSEQPAARSESDSEGGDKPQPEAEGRSR